MKTRVIKAIQATAESKNIVKSTDSIVTDLGFDSLRMVNLSISLEKQFRRSLLLNDWVSQFDHPQQMTVVSLYKYIEHLLSQEQKLRRRKK